MNKISDALFKILYSLKFNNFDESLKTIKTRMCAFGWKENPLKPLAYLLL